MSARAALVLTHFEHGLHHMKINEITVLFAHSSGIWVDGQFIQGQLFRGVNKYYDPETANFGGIFAPQRNGPIPLGDQCGAAGLSSSASCPLGGLATNGDSLTQVSQAQGQIWAATSTQIAQTYTRANAEIHMGAVYWVLGTRSFDSTGKFTLTGQGYVAAKHEDLTMPAMAGTPRACFKSGLM